MQDFPTVEPGSEGCVGVEIMPENYNLLTCDGPPYAMDPVDEELTTVTCGKSTQVSAWHRGWGGGGCQMPAVVGAHGWLPRYASGGGQKGELFRFSPGFWSLLGVTLEDGPPNAVVGPRNSSWGLASQQTALALQQAGRRMEAQHHELIHGNFR